MLYILCVKLTIKVKVGIPESFKVGWYPPKKTGSSHLNIKRVARDRSCSVVMNLTCFNELIELKYMFQTTV